MITPPNQNQTPPPNGRFVLEPMPEGPSFAAIIEALLKHPGRLVHELQNRGRASLPTLLLLFALFGMVTYGVVVGSFSGGPQKSHSALCYQRCFVCRAFISLPVLAESTPDCGRSWEHCSRQWD